MEKLNELVRLAKAARNNPMRETITDFELSCQPETILSIAEAFRALEQRAETAEAKLEVERNIHDETVQVMHLWRNRAKEAEAKLAELEKQEPVAFTEECDITNMQATGLYLRGFPDNSSGRNIKLFTRPAPAINLAELVPEEMTPKQASRSYGGEVSGYRDGFNACRVAIMGNIEEEK